MNVYDRKYPCQVNLLICGSLIIAMSLCLTFLFLPLCGDLVLALVLVLSHALAQLLFLSLSPAPSLALATQGRKVECDVTYSTREVRSRLDLEGHDPTSLLMSRDLNELLSCSPPPPQIITSITLMTIFIFTSLNLRCFNFLMLIQSSVEFFS